MVIFKVLLLMVAIDLYHSNFSSIYPTDHFAILKLQDTFINVYELHTIRRTYESEVLKL